MRVIFMGTPDFSVRILEAVIDAGHEVMLAVSQPDKAVGRSKALKYTPVKACAVAHGIEVYQPERVKDAECIAYLRKYRPDIIIVVAFGQIISKELLELPKYGCINVHASLLPKYRGAAPIQWSIINGDRVTGVTTMRMDEGVDTGDMILKEEVPIGSDDTGESLFKKLSDAGAELCVRTMQAIEDGSASYTPQDERDATHTAKINKETGNIDWNKDAEAIECLIRGLDPWPSAYTRIRDKTLKIWKARVVSYQRKAAPGTVVEADKKHIYVQAGNGVLELLEVQLEGKKRMPAEVFLNGYHVEAGTALHRC